jgi:hypothetical protein
MMTTLLVGIGIAIVSATAGAFLLVALALNDTRRAKKKAANGKSSPN